MDPIKRAYQEFSFELPPHLSHLEEFLPSEEEAESMLKQLREAHRDGTLVDSIQRGLL